MSDIVMNLSLFNFSVVLFFIFLAGLIDAIAGGGGLISLPAYWAFGLPPHQALATNKFSSVWGTAASTTRYLHANMIDIPVALVSAAYALLGSWLGTTSVLLVSSTFLNYLLLVLVPLITILTVIKKRFGSVNQSKMRPLINRICIGSYAGFVIGFYDGFFGPGTGTFLIIIFTVLLHYDLVMANGNTKVINFASNLAAVVTFARAGMIFMPLAIPAAACGIAGNLLGSRLVIHRGNAFIRKIFFPALLLLFIRVLFNLID